MIYFIKNENSEQLNYYIFRDLILNVFEEECKFSRGFFILKEFESFLEKIDENYIFIFWNSEIKENLKMGFDEDGDYCPQKSNIVKTCYEKPVNKIKELLSKYDFNKDYLINNAEEYFYDEYYGDGKYFKFIKLKKEDIKTNQHKGNF